MFTFKAGDVRPPSAFLLFMRGLMDGVGDGVSLRGLGGHWRAGSLTVNGEALFPCGLRDLGSEIWSVGAAGELWTLLLHTNTQTHKNTLVTLQVEQIFKLSEKNLLEFY